MKKPVILALVGVVILIAVLGAVKALQIGAMIDQARSSYRRPKP